MSDPAGERETRPEHAKLGPMVFVPELSSRGPDDPWAHRKGEPRYFALFWTFYLLVSALLTVFSIRAVGLPTQEQFLLGGRGMTLMCALGVCPLWPMVRLSQRRAEHPAKASFFDGLILTVPSCSVILPISLLTGWTITISAALCLMLIAWAVVSGGMVTLGSASESKAWRFACMALTWALTLAGPSIAWLGATNQWWGAGSSATDILELLSPVSAVFVLSEPSPGAVYSFAVPDGGWWWILAPSLTGLLAWGAGWAALRRDAKGSTGAGG